VSTGSILYRGSHIGENVYIADMVNIRERCTIDHDSMIGKCASIEYGVTIGHHSRIFDCSQITELTEIGNDVFIGPDVSLVVDPSFGRRKDDDRKIVISDNAMIGGNASIGPGVTVGENSLVAMGAVVLKDVPSRKVMLGNPARVWWDVEKDLIREPRQSSSPTQKIFIPIAKPLIGDEEKQAVLKVMESGALAQGAVVSEFEKQFAAYIGSEHAIAVSSGTTALHLSLLAAGIGPGDEVITSPFTFIASANSIIYVGAKPVKNNLSEYELTDEEKQAINEALKSQRG
jgi:acetyltransferase-like isoleucine patch superfamily enzyme